jgi:SAM-dependent methyltransferase
MKPQGPEGIHQLGHRAYVGGMWDEIGRLQFDYLVSEGLRPHHYLLDIGCGALRGGRFFIEYLEYGRYYGLDRHVDLIHAGISELGSLYAAKEPTLWGSDSFDMVFHADSFDYALAQSLFTHLTPGLIALCFANLRQVIAPDGVFYATYFEGTGPNPSEPHDHGRFEYTRAEMEAFGGDRWKTEYVGDWGHPRGQVMVRYRPL